MSEQASPTRLIRLPEVLRRVPLSRTRIYELVNDGRFPRPIKLSERAVAWRSADVEQWIAERGEQSRQAVAA